MKNFYFLLMLACSCWWLSSCIDKKTKSKDVLKQVEVAVKTANLRTGPGTRYTVASPPNKSKGKWQVKRGTVLNIVAAEKGWYQVYVTDQTHTAYIKQSLCCEKGQSRARRDDTQGKKSHRSDVASVGESPSDNPSSAGSSSSAPSSSKSSSAATDDDFEEEVEEAPYIPKTR